MDLYSGGDFLPSQLQDKLIPAALGLLFALMIWFVAGRFMRAWRKERLARLSGVRTFTAVPTSSPYSDLQDKARSEAEKNVQARFSVMRAVLIVSLGGLVVILGAMPFLGRLPQTLLSFLVAASIAVVGIAARPFIENFICGLVLSFSRQLRVGDTVLLDAEQYGTVEDINPTHTVVKLWDWRRYVVPNASMLQKEVVNYTHKDNYLWTHVPFHVTPRADMKLVEEIAVNAAGESKFVAPYEEPQFWVRELLAGSTLCWIAAWAKNPEDAWYLRADIRRQVCERLRAEGIDTQLNTHRVVPFAKA